MLYRNDLVILYFLIPFPPPPNRKTRSGHSLRISVGKNLNSDIYLDSFTQRKILLNHSVIVLFSKKGLGTHKKTRIPEEKKMSQFLVIKVVY